MQFAKQVVGPRKMEEWQFLLNEQSPDFQVELRRRQREREKTLKCISSVFSGTGRRESMCQGLTRNLVVPFGLNIHKNIIQFGDTSKTEKCSRGVQTDESLILLYIQEKLLRQGAKMLHFRMNMSERDMRPRIGEMTIS